MKRLFIAFKLSLDTEYIELAAALRRRTSYDSMTWVEQELHHCTLRFLGKTPDSQIAPLVEIMETVCASVAPFEMTINRLGLFGSRYAPKVLWLGFEEQPNFFSLYQDLESRLIACGFPANEGNFVPHLTLARIRMIQNKKRFTQLIEESQPLHRQKIVVSEIILFQSRLEKEGPIYIELAKCALRG